MIQTAPQPVPIVAFKNIIVTVSEDSSGTLQPNCVEMIGCNSRDTLLNFQIANQAEAECDYRFELPGLRGDVTQFGKFTISPSGKMLTVCNATSAPGSIFVTLKVYDHVTPSKKGAFDPEVANQPDGMALPR